MSNIRPLHFVLKVGNRTATTQFFREILGMKNIAGGGGDGSSNDVLAGCHYYVVPDDCIHVITYFLRHEEFEEGCKASCNGPYDGKWSKSMVGYGPENNHFVLELTYNYGIGSYERGNDLMGIKISSPDVWERVHRHDYPHTSCDDDNYMITSPDGVKFHISKEAMKGDPMQKVMLLSSDLQRTIDFWSGLCGMKIYTQDGNKVLLGYADDKCKLEFTDLRVPVEHAKAFGRTAFSCPAAELAGIEERLLAANQTILTPLVSLDTPGKATVQVVIPADPDGHEICFVGDEAFRELSQVDPQADQLLDKAIEADKSDEWFAKKGQTKSSA